MQRMTAISRRRQMELQAKKGVVSQIITKGMPEEIDTVSRATCSSNAIIDGCKKALEMALRPEETEAQ